MERVINNVAFNGPKNLTHLAAHQRDFDLLGEALVDSLEINLNGSNLESVDMDFFHESSKVFRDHLIREPQEINMKTPKIHRGSDQTAEPEPDNEVLQSQARDIVASANRMVTF